jgi:DNA topoisomerase-3
MEAKIFDMIARRFVAAFYPAAEFDITTRLSTVAGHDLQDRGQGAHLPRLARRLRQEPPSTTTRPTRRRCPRSPPPTASPPAQAKTVEALHAETTKPPPRYTEATLLSAMEGAGKLVDDEDLAEAMKERGLGTPATRADTIDGLINQKYMERAAARTRAHRQGRAVDPVPRRRQGRRPHQARHDRRVGIQAPPDGARQVLPREVHGRDRRGDEGHRRAREEFRGGRLRRRVTDIPSPTDGKPMRETLRGYKSQDGELMVYKVIGGRRMEEAEIRELVTTGEVGPLDGFISRKTRNRFSAKLRLIEDPKNEGQKWKVELDFGDKFEVADLTPFWTDPKTGAELCEAADNYVLREREGEGWKQTFRVGRSCARNRSPRGGHPAGRARARPS